MSDATCFNLLSSCSPQGEGEKSPILRVLGERREERGERGEGRGEKLRVAGHLARHSLLLLDVATPNQVAGFHLVLILSERMYDTVSFVVINILDYVTVLRLLLLLLFNVKLNYNSLRCIVWKDVFVSFRD